jgi:hypothetical protein
MISRGCVGRSLNSDGVEEKERQSADECKAQALGVMCKPQGCASQLQQMM